MSPIMPKQSHRSIEYNRVFARRPLLVIGISAVIIAAAWVMLRAALFPSCDRLSCVRVAGAAKWKEKEVYEHTATSYRALLTDSSYMIRIEKRSKLSKSDAMLLTKVNVMKIMGLFDDARSPYPGIVSDRIHCEDSLKPTMEQLNNDGLDVTYMRAGLNSRLQYGTCVESELPFISYGASFYCPDENALYQLEFIIERKHDSEETYKNVIRGIRCERRTLPSLRKEQFLKTP